jgi:hypothetical protein
MQFSASVCLTKSVIWYKYVNCYKQPHSVVPKVRDNCLILSLEYFLSIMSVLLINKIYTRLSIRE